MRKYWLLILATMVLATAITGSFLASTNHKKIAGVIAPAVTQHPKVEKYEVPILMYHYIRNAEGENDLRKRLSVSPANFNLQMEYLKKQDYATIKLADLVDPDKKELSRIYFEKKKPIIFTFDDGYLDAYTEAFPTLKRYNFTGAFFIIRSYTDRALYLSQAQINEMQRAGMEIGSHTLTHPDLRKISINEQRKQIFDSKEDAITFCYPAGKYNSKTVSLAKEAGYLAAVTTKIGVVNETSDLLELPRVRVENVSPEVLLDKITYAKEYP